MHSTQSDISTNARERQDLFGEVIFVSPPVVLPYISSTTEEKQERGIVRFVGMLWNGDKEFTRDMIRDLSDACAITSLRFYSLGSEYEKFIEDCYEFEKDNPEIPEYIIEKTNRLKSYGNSSIVSFNIQITDPIYDYDYETDRFKCRQISSAKRVLREKYRECVEDYFFDVLIHISDMPEETEFISEVLGKYSEYSRPMPEHLIQGSWERIVKKQTRQQQNRGKQ